MKEIEDLLIEMDNLRKQREEKLRKEKEKAEKGSEEDKSDCGTSGDTGKESKYKEREGIMTLGVFFVKYD